MSKLSHLAYHYNYFYKIIDNSCIKTKRDVINDIEYKIIHNIGDVSDTFKKHQIAELKKLDVAYVAVGNNGIPRDVLNRDVDNLIDNLIRYTRHNLIFDRA